MAWMTALEQPSPAAQAKALSVQVIAGRVARVAPTATRRQNIAPAGGIAVTEMRRNPVPGLALDVELVIGVGSPSRYQYNRIAASVPST